MQLSLHRRSHPIHLLLWTLGAMLLSSWFFTQAHAQGARVLILQEQFEGEVSKDLRQTLQSSLKKSLRSDRRGFDLLDAGKTRAMLMDKNPSLAGCESERCLKRMGETLGASAAIKTRVFGEAQIYDYKIWIFDLSTGKIALNEKVTCEICTSEEAEQLYARSLRDALKRVKIVKIQAAPPSKPVTPTPKAVAKPKLSRTVKVQVVALPEEAFIELGDLPLGTGTGSMNVKPGTYTLKASAEGYQSREMTLNIKPKEADNIKVHLLLAPNATTETDTTPGPVIRDTQEDYGSKGLRIAGWTMIVTGLASTGAGAYLLSIDGDTTCNTGTVQQCPRVFNTTTEGSLLVGGGAAILTSGIFMAILGAGPDKPEQAPTAQGFNLNLDPTSKTGFMTFSGSF